MMDNNRSILRFEKYMVKSITFEANEEYSKVSGGIKLDFDFDAETVTSGNNLTIELSARIFDNAIIKNYPFEMCVVLKGFFSMESDDDNINVATFETNAIAILFPYLRAMVSTYTANANVSPVLLPAMNINEYIRKKYQNGEKQV